MDNAKMPYGSTVSHFVQRFQELQTQRETMESLFQNLAIYCGDMENQIRHGQQMLHNCQLDLADATNTRRDLQQRIHLYESRFEKLIKENDNLKNRNPYLMVLIDGDGLIFQERWIRQGVEGGKKAAYALRNLIAEKFIEDMDDIEIVAKVVANLSGLTKAMHREGGSDAQHTMKEFALGFTQAKASFDFIDVGYGKERADSKIKELTRWNLRNHNCKHIALGISHDSGYAPFLDEIFQDDITRHRLSVLEGVSTVKEIVATQVNIVPVEGDIFRREKLTAGPALTPTLIPAPAPAAAAAVVPAPIPAPAATTVVTTQVTTTSRNTSPTASLSSYAGIAGASPPPVMTLPLNLKPMPVRQKSSQSSTYQLIPPQQPDWDPGYRGLDEPIRVNVNVLDAIKRRKDNDKLCNNHFLRGACAKRDLCPFVHDYKPTEDEINAIAVLARQHPCAGGQYCESLECIYGHHCPSVRDGVCIHPFCRFSEEGHPPGTKYKTSYTRNN